GRPGAAPAAHRAACFGPASCLGVGAGRGAGMRTLELPAGLEATAPPTVRDGVRLLVARPDGLEHARFAQLGEFLVPGDLLVVNTSATLPAAVDGSRGDGLAVTVHFAAEMDDRSWVVEVRPQQDATGPVPDTRADDVIV